MSAFIHCYNEPVFLPVYNTACNARLKKHLSYSPPRNRYQLAHMEKYTAMPHTFHYLNGTSLFKNKKNPPTSPRQNLTARHTLMLPNTAKLCAFSSEGRSWPLLLKIFFLIFQILCLQKLIGKVGGYFPSFLAHLCALCTRPPRLFSKVAELKENAAATALLVDLAFWNKSSLVLPLIKKQ